jgi:trehalose 6-phosphate phosphatase
MPQRPRGEVGPAASVRKALAHLLDDPASTAVLTDFDGTLSPIVNDPYEARPLEGVGEVMASLATRFGEVAVISGRSVAFLEQHLSIPAPSNARHRVRLVGLYGLEQSWGDGRVVVEPAAERWRQVVDYTVARLRADAPDGVLVEPKGLAVTIHWRRAPDEAGWVSGAVAGEVERSGLTSHPGRMSVELRPPLDVDKGSVVRGLAASSAAVCYLGDDLGDLPAFDALHEMATGGGIDATAIAVVDNESDARVAAAADVVLAGPARALEVLVWLSRSAGTSEV